MMKKLIALSTLIAMSIFAQPAYAAEYDHTALKVETSTVPTFVSVGDTGQILPNQKSEYKSFRNAFTYKISDPSVVKIENDGTWTALKNGEVSLEIIPVNIDTATPAFLNEMKKFGYEFPQIMPDIFRSSKHTVIVSDPIPVFRLYNSVTFEHLYTVDTRERDVLSGLKDWTYEGIAWNSPDKYGTPVYRLYNHLLGRHHYTADQNEIKVLSEHSWVNEGIAFYSSGSTPIYRLYLDLKQTHLLTVDKIEADILSQEGMWQYEGIALHAK